jgi:hypothetical protein
MATVEERIRLAVESVMENESIAEELDSDVAQALMDWGIACAEDIALSTGGMDDRTADSAIYRAMRALRQVMRSARDWVVQGEEADRAYLIDKIARNGEFAYRRPLLLDDERTSHLLNLPNDNPLATLQTLRRFAENQPLTPPENPDDDSFNIQETDQESAQE